MALPTGQTTRSDVPPAAEAQGTALTAPVLDPLPPDVAAAYHRATLAAAVYLDQRLQTANSRRTMEASLDVLAGILTEGRATARTCPWAALQYQHTVALPGLLQARGYKRTTVGKMLSALRGVLREAWRLGDLDRDRFERLGDIQPMKGEELAPSAGRAMTQGELIALFHACGRDEGPAGRRDAAIVALLYGCGLRRSELPPIQLADFNADTGALAIRQGKGGKARIVYVAGGALAALEAWLAVRTTVTTTGVLFLPINRHGRLIVRQMSDQAIYDVLRKRGEQAKLREAFSPHDFRRTFIGDLLDAGADIAVVQRLAGHANVTTTARYDRRGEKAKADAAARLHVPFTR